MPAPDLCPFPRPFPDDFDGCPAYTPAEFITEDTGGRLMEVATCCFLSTERSPGSVNAFYPRCRHGTPAARQEWAEEVGVGRLRRVRHAWQELAPPLRPLMRELIQARRRSLDAGGRTPDQGLDGVRRRWARAIREYTENRKELMDELGVSAETVSEIVASIRDHLFAEPASKSTWTIPDELLTKLSPAAARFFRPWTARTESPPPD